MIFGFSSFGEFVLSNAAFVELPRNELDKKPVWAEQDIGRLLKEIAASRSKLEQLINDQSTVVPEIKQQLELQLHEYLRHMSEMLDDREFTAAPGIFSITIKDRSRWNPASYFKQTFPGGLTRLYAICV